MTFYVGGAVYSPKRCPLEGEAGLRLEDAWGAQEGQEGWGVGGLRKMPVEIALLSCFLIMEQPSLSSENFPDSEPEPVAR